MKPPSNRPPGNRPPGNRPPGNRPPGNRPPGHRPPDNRPPGHRPPDNRPSGERAVGERSSGHGADRAGAPGGAPRSGGGKPAFGRGKPDARASGAGEGRARQDWSRGETSRPEGGRQEGGRRDAPRAPHGGRASLSLPVAPERGQERGSERGQERATRGPAGTIWLFGIHAVAAALANPARLLRRLMLTEEAEAEILARLPKGLPLQPERTDRARLDQLLGRGVVHQGVALLSDPLPQLSLQQALERPGPVLVLDQVSDPRNVGAIIRSAAAFGAACVIVQDRNAPDETGTMAKSASGAMERIPLLRAVNIARTLIALRAAGLWIVGLDGGGPKLSGAALAQRRVALVLGNEGEGMRRLTRETCDEVAGIELPGGSVALESLNVSAAAAVALYELGRVT